MQNINISINRPICRATHTMNLDKSPSVKFYNFVRGIGAINNDKVNYTNAVEEYLKNKKKYPSLLENITDEIIIEMKEDLGIYN